MLSLRVTDTIAEHLENTPCPSEVTEFGMANDSRFPHPLNARAPILVNPSPWMVTDLRFSQPSNALAGIAVTVAGIVTRTTSLPLNTAASNAVTGLPPSVSGIVRFVVSKETAETVPPLYVHTFPDVSVHVSAHTPKGASVPATARKAAANVFNFLLMFICFSFPFMTGEGVGYWTSDTP